MLRELGMKSVHRMIEYNKIRNPECYLKAPEKIEKMKGLQKLIGKIEWSKMHTLRELEYWDDGCTAMAYFCEECMKNKNVDIFYKCIDDFDSLYEKSNYITNRCGIFCEDLRSVSNWCKYFKAINYYNDYYYKYGNNEARKIIKKLENKVKGKLI